MLIYRTYDLAGRRLTVGFNPRHVPWMTIFGVIGLGSGYLIGKAGETDPEVPAFWGLVIGSAVAVVLRTILTLRWSRQERERNKTEQV